MFKTVFSNSSRENGFAGRVGDVNEVVFLELCISRVKTTPWNVKDTIESCKRNRRLLSHQEDLAGVSSDHRVEEGK